MSRDIFAALFFGIGLASVVVRQVFVVHIDASKISGFFEPWRF